MAFKEEWLSLEERAKKKIKAVLEKCGCRIIDSKIPKEFSLRDIPVERKRAMIEFVGSKFDLLISRHDPYREYYLCECKGKSWDSTKTWVNQEDYDKYWEIASLPFPFLYFIWTEDLDKIYRHEVTNPEDFRKGVAPDKKPLYFIPEKVDFLPAKKGKIHEKK